MQILITTKWTYTQGPDITINCPKCGTAGATAHTQGTEEKNSLFWLIPLFTPRYTKLTCGNCGKSFRLVKPLDEVEQLNPEAISQNLEKSVPFLIKFCIVSSIALFIIPFVGIIFGSIGLAATARKPSGWKKAAIIGLVLSLLPVAAMIIVLILKK
jgi:hypothetical protein